MGKRKQNPTIGYWYSMGLYTGEVRDADVLLGIYAGGKTVWEGEMRGDGTLQINKPELFGGEKKEGGLVGTLWVRKGGQDQLPHPYLVAQVPGPWPAGRGIVTCLYDGIVGAMNPYIKPWQKCWGRWQATALLATLLVSLSGSASIQFKAFHVFSLLSGISYLL